MNESIKTVIIRGQQKFNLHDVLDPAQIEIKNDWVLNIIKNIKIFTIN